MTARRAEIDRLWKARPRSRLLRAAVLGAVILMVTVWFFPGIDAGRLSAAKRGENFDAFVTEITPYPLRKREEVRFEGPPDARRRVVEQVDPPWDGAVFLKWAGDLWKDGGGEAVRKTVAISILAIALAGLWGALLSLLAARNFARPSPFLPAVTRPSVLQRGAWRVVGTGTRAGLVVMRAVPEYIWAFFLVALIGVRPGVGVSAWAAVLALALHNAGILGRLGGEAIENTPPATLASLRRLGAGRMQVAAAGLFPAVLPRYLLYFFYRWETCVREATVLGTLGVVSLGYLIQKARSGQGYADEMVYYVLLGAGIVIVGDLLSALARALVRRA